MTLLHTYSSCEWTSPKRFSRSSVKGQDHSGPNAFFCNK